MCGAFILHTCTIQVVGDLYHGDEVIKTVFSALCLNGNDHGLLQDHSHNYCYNYLLK